MVNSFHKKPDTLIPSTDACVQTTLQWIWSNPDLTGPCQLECTLTLQQRRTYLILRNSDIHLNISEILLSSGGVADYLIWAKAFIWNRKRTQRRNFSTGGLGLLDPTVHPLFSKHFNLRSYDTWIQTGNSREKIPGSIFCSSAQRETDKPENARRERQRAIALYFGRARETQYRKDAESIVLTPRSSEQWEHTRWHVTISETRRILRYVFASWFRSSMQVKWRVE